MRPAFHFTPAAGWINDPHGLRHHDGEYHAFFQYIPERTEWSEDIHWGHAKGADLLSLEELPVAIFARRRRRRHLDRLARRRRRRRRAHLLHVDRASPSSTTAASASPPPTSPTGSRGTRARSSPTPPPR